MRDGWDVAICNAGFVLRFAMVLSQIVFPTDTRTHASLRGTDSGPASPRWNIQDLPKIVRDLYQRSRFQGAEAGWHRVAELARPLKCSRMQISSRIGSSRPMQYI